MAASGSIELAQNQQATLAPGVYGDLSAKQNATLHLQPGRYHFGAIDLGQKVNIELDLAATADSDDIGQLFRFVPDTVPSDIGHGSGLISDSFSGPSEWCPN